MNSRNKIFTPTAAACHGKNYMNIFRKQTVFVNQDTVTRPGVLPHHKYQLTKDIKISAITDPQCTSRQSILIDSAQERTGPLRSR